MWYTRAKKSGIRCTNFTSGNRLYKNREYEFIKIFFEVFLEENNENNKKNEEKKRMKKMKKMMQ